MAACVSLGKWLVRFPITANTPLHWTLKSTVISHRNQVLPHIIDDRMSCYGGFCTKITLILIMMMWRMCVAFYSIRGELFASLLWTINHTPIQARPRWTVPFVNENKSKNSFYFYFYISMKLTVKSYCIEAWSYLGPSKEEGIWTSNILMGGDPILRWTEIKMTNVYSLWQGTTMGGIPSKLPSICLQPQYGAIPSLASLLSVKFLGGPHH